MFLIDTCNIVTTFYNKTKQVWIGGQRFLVLYSGFLTQIQILLVDFCTFPSLCLNLYVIAIETQAYYCDDDKKNNSQA